MKIIESRNKREGRYAGWRVTGGRNELNWRNCKQINHEREGGAYYPKTRSLHYWVRQWRAA